VRRFDTSDEAENYIRNFKGWFRPLKFFVLIIFIFQND
jgi:hypothetical protein